MRITLLDELLRIASPVLPSVPAQQSDALRRLFLEYKAKAEKGDAEAQHNLGVSYANGEGVEKDYAEAEKWYRKAAEQNFAKAQHNLGISYSQGHGVEKVKTEAYAWFNLAAKTEEEAAKTRDRFEKLLSSQEIADGQRRTQELRAEIESKLKNRGR